jgi:hypothetical protein
MRQIGRGKVVTERLIEIGNDREMLGRDCSESFDRGRIHECNVRDAEDRTVFERLIEGYVRVPDVGGRIVRSQRFGGRECREGARL